MIAVVIGGVFDTVVTVVIILNSFEDTSRYCTLSNLMSRLDFETITVNPSADIF
jgi:hypothetical protein